MEMIQRAVKELSALAVKIEPGRNTSGIVNDMFEAAKDWRYLGQMIHEHYTEEGWDFRGRVKQETELFDGLGAFYGAKLNQNPDYARIMELGAQIIAVGKQLKPHPDGYLGSKRIVRQTFAFLQSEFGLTPGEEPDGMWDYASDRVCVLLRLPTSFNAWCRVGQPSDPSKSFELEDLLFMAGKSVSLALPPGQAITTEADVQAWFTTVAEILRQYGSDVLANRPGAFERLAQAAAERERLTIEENERLYGSGKPG